MHRSNLARLVTAHQSAKIRLTVPSMTGKQAEFAVSVKRSPKTAMLQENALKVAIARSNPYAARRRQAKAVIVERTLNSMHPYGATIQLTATTKR
jgi:hypothetical protein